MVNKNSDEDNNNNNHNSNTNGQPPALESAEHNDFVPLKFDMPFICMLINLFI